jgi:hypothetical protein
MFSEGGQQKTVVGTLVVDEKIDTSALSQSDVAGNYKTVLASTTTQLDTLYIFENDGFGGFEWTYAGNTDFTSWAWSFSNGLMQATRYRFENGGLATDTPCLELWKANMMRMAVILATKMLLYGPSINSKF